MWHWSQQPPISAPFIHGHTQSHIPSHAPSHAPSHQLPTHPMAVHHLAPQMTSHFTPGQPPFVGYPQFNQGEFSHSTISGFSGQMVAPPTQLPMPGGAGWAERHVANISSEHLLTAVGGGYPTRGLNHDSVQGGPSVGQAMAALTPTPTLPQTPPLPSASTALPGPSLRTSPLEPLVSPHVTTPQQPLPQLSHPAVGSSPFSVDFLLRERPASMEGGEIPTHSYTQQDMRNSVTTNFPDGVEGMGRYATHTPQEMATVPSGFGEGGEQVGGVFPPPCPPGSQELAREPFGDSSGELQQFANSREALPQFAGSSDDLPQLSQQEVAEETAGAFPDKLSPFQLPSDFSSPSSPAEDSDKLAIALPPEKPFSPPQLVLTNSEESQPQDLDQSDHSSIAMQGDITGSHVMGTLDSSPRPDEGMAQQSAGGGRPAELLDREPREEDTPALTLATVEPEGPPRDLPSRTAELRVEPSKTTAAPRRPFMVRHKHDYESEDDDVFLPNSPHRSAQQQPHPPEQSAVDQPHPPRPTGGDRSPDQSGWSQPHPLEQSEVDQPHPPQQSRVDRPHSTEQSGVDRYSPEQRGRSQPHPPEQGDGYSPEQSGQSQPHPPEASSAQSQPLTELELGNPSSSAANEVPAAAAAPPLVYRRRRGPRVALDQEKLQLPLTKGWRRLVRTRHLPDQLPRVDICYVTPCDRRLRTFPDIQRYLDNKREAGGETVGVDGLEMEHFSFSKRAEVGEMIEIGGKPDESSSNGLNATRKTGRGRRKVAREPKAPEAGGIDAVPTKTEGRGRGRGRRRGRPRVVAGSAGGLGRGERKQREDTFTVEPQQGAPGGRSLEDQVSRPAELPLLTMGAEFAPPGPEGMEAQGHRISLEPHEISQQLGNDGADSHDMSVGFRGKSHDVYQNTYGAVNHTEGRDAGLSVSAAGHSEEHDTPPANSSATRPLALPGDPSPLSTLSIAAPTVAAGQPPSATPTQLGSAASKPEGVRRRVRKRLDPTRIEPPSAPAIKRPRGRPKGTGKPRRELPMSATAQPQVKKRRGRRPKLHLLSSASTRHLMSTESAQASQDGNHGNLGNAVCAVAGSPEPLKDGNATPSMSHVTTSVSGVSVIVPAALPSAADELAGRQEPEQHGHGKARKEEKRRQLLLKARVDRAKKKAESKHIQRAIITQRRLAQRQRRERERMLMKQARDRQEKLTRHKETEERELRRQRLAQQRVVENQRRAQERTRRLLAHLRQQEIDRERLALQHQRDKERAEQLKRPTEDLLVTDLAPLPALHPMTWVVLPAPAFANLLMAVEFGRSFEEFLELERLPSVWELVGGLYSLDPQPLELFCVQLLKAVLYSPGSDARTASGCAIGRIEVREDTLSELLRLYLTEMAELEEIASSLWTLPLAALRPSQKAGLLGFLVEELLASSALTREVDTRMDQVAALRRDKWKISLKIKRFRSRLSEVYGVGLEKKPVVYSGRGRPPKRALMGLSLPEVGGDSSDEGEDPANPATNEELEQGSESEYSEEETDEETPEAKEELQKRIKVLKKKLQCLRVLIHSSSRQMRKFPLGLDRYARQYWLLPGLGGIIVEGVETSLRGNHHWDLSLEERCSDENLVGGVVGGVVKEEEEEASFHGHNQSDLSAGEISEVDVVCVDSEVKCGGGVLGGGCDPGSRGKGGRGSVDGGTGVGLSGQSVERQRSDDAAGDIRRHSLEAATGLQEEDCVPSKQFESNPDSATSMGTGQTNPMASTRDPEAIAMAMVTNPSEPRLEDSSDGASVVRMWNAKSEVDMQFRASGASSDHVCTRLPFAESDTRPLPLPPSEATATSALQHTTVLCDDSQRPSPIAIQIQDQSSMESSPSVGSQTDTAPSVSSSTAVLAGDAQMPSEPNSPQGGRLGNDTEERGATPQLECTETAPTFSHGLEEVPSDRWSSGNGPLSISHDPSKQSLVAHDQPAGPSPAPTSHDSGCPSPCPSPSPQPWFSIFPRQPCERATYAAVDPSQLQLAGGQQFLMPAPAAQYAYMTPGGKPVLSQPMLQQVGVGYTLVGNTLVPQAQYISVNPSQAVQYAVGQQGVQYVTIGGQQQPQGVVAIGGQQQPQGMVAIGGQQQPQGMVAIGGQQQPQGMVAIGGQQQPQSVVAIGGQQQPQGMVAIGGQQQPQGVVAIGGQQQPQNMVVIGGQQQPQGVVAIGGQQQPQGVVAIGGQQQPQGVVAIGGQQQPQGVVAIGGQQQPQGVVAIGGQQQPQGMVAIGGQQQPQGVVAIGGQQQPQGMVAIGGQQQPQGMVAIGGQQQPQGMVAIGGQQQPQGIQVVFGNQQPQGMVAIGAQQPQGLQYISLGGGQVAVVQTGGEVGVAPVETQTESEVGGASAGDSVPSQGKLQLDVDSAQPSPGSTHPDSGSSPAVVSLSKDKAIPESHTPSYGPKLSESEEIHRVPNPAQTPTSQLVVQGDASETTPSAPPTSQYLTAVLPTGPGGQSQYVTLPADPRVLAGQCSYAVLQQSDGTSQIVLVETSSLGYSQSGVMSLECPPPSLMCNEPEGQPWLTDITLMYAEHLPFLTPRPPHNETPPPREKTLPQLLAEQDRGLTHGWWQVTDTRQVDRILRSLSHRGYREKGLFKALQKNKEHISNLLEPSELIRCQTSFAELPKRGGTVGGVRSEPANCKSSEPSDLKVGLVQGDSGSEEAMEVEGEPLVAQPDKDVATSHSSGDHHMTEAAGQPEEGSVHDMMFPELAYEAALQVLEYLEGMQERLFEAELQSAGSSLRSPLADKLREERPPQGFPLPSIASALLHLELSVDRRYLKPPLIAKSLVQDKPRSGSPHKGGRGRGRSQPPPPPKAVLEAPPTTELLQWRSAVGVASSASQLAVCANQLECCVAWEKSATKVFCKVCHSSESESLLLLCDCCDRGTHTYCCKPKLDAIPDGDWYCAECAVAKRKLGSCDVCESPRGVLLHCTSCARTVHKRCLNPPLSKMPSLPWQCHKCKKHPPRVRPKGGTSSPAKKRPPKPLDDTAICRQMLRALEQHEEAGPFLEPVRKRKFPEYFRVIKRPMDFHTIKIRLREGRYPDKEAFAEEVRLVFSNCAFYNEDDSEIGVAGHSMKAFFEKRWSELSQ